jgi:hypothetical protein
MGVSDPAYSRERLAEIKARNETGVEFRGNAQRCLDAKPSPKRDDPLLA